MLKVDLHTHTLKSDCGSCTFLEMVNEAARKKVKLLGITDHGPFFPYKAFNEIVHFHVFGRFPKKIRGVQLMYGVEANIFDDKGDIGLPKKVLERLDFVAAGFHSNSAYKDLGVKGNTKAVLEVMKNPFVKMLTHPYIQQYEVDIEKIVVESKKRNVLLELNNAYFLDYKMKTFPKLFETAKKMVRVIQENDLKLILGSDAHITTELGMDDKIRKYQKKLGLKDKTIINNDIDAVKEYLGVD